VQLTTIDLFAGCGGLSLGLEQTGAFRAVLAIDSDPHAAATYGVNFPDTEVVAGLIEDVHTVPRADVVVGGPPCQGFSALNRHKVGMARRELWRQYLRILAESRADVFVMENVPELLASAEFAAFAAAAQADGFAIVSQILDAADYGVPQRRRRAIVIGMRGGRPEPPTATHAGTPSTLFGDRGPWKTFRDAVADLPLVPDGRGWHRPRQPTQTSMIRYAAVPRDGGDRFQMQARLDARGLGHLVPPCWRRKPTGTTDVFGRLWWDRPSVTIRTEFYKPEKGRYLHPSEDRPITVREAAQLMSFPSAFIFPEAQSMTAVGRQIGNAVPPLLAAAIGRSIVRSLASTARGSAAA
jgi:DNA (cytosine-5)-methyltransferase 1